MTFTATPLSGSFVIDLQPFQDDRGWFARYFSKDLFEQIGHTREWVQMNHSVTYKKGAVRGLHFQVKPYREVKMVRCIAGAVYDVIVDLREGSSTFLQWFGAELSAANRRTLYIPEGFAHGFQCLTRDCELLYHHTEFYTPGAEAGLRYDDPVLNIAWPMNASQLSARDEAHPYLTENFKGI